MENSIISLVISFYFAGENWLQSSLCSPGQRLKRIWNIFKFLNYCVDCQTGYYQDATDHELTYCIPCDRGSFSMNASSFCEPCSEGHFAPDMAQSACYECDPGTFQPNTGNYKLSNYSKYNSNKKYAILDIALWNRLI